MTNLPRIGGFDPQGRPLQTQYFAPSKPAPVKLNHQNGYLTGSVDSKDEMLGSLSDDERSALQASGETVPRSMTVEEAREFQRQIERDHLKMTGMQTHKLPSMAELAKEQKRRLSAADTIIHADASGDPDQYYHDLKMAHAFEREQLDRARHIKKVMGRPILVKTRTSKKRKKK
jgi:hypothetical protein